MFLMVLWSLEINQSSVLVAGNNKYFLLSEFEPVDVGASDTGG